MESIDLQVLIAGAVLPFIISLLKRWIKLTKQQISLIVIAVSFIIATVFEFIENSPTFEEYLLKIGSVYGSSQFIYWTVIKLPELDKLIEESN
jgi:hypothetical protein